MTPTTKPQRQAIKRVFDRCPLDANCDRLKSNSALTPISYRQYRAMARPVIFDDSIMVNWCNMWLGIEPDGHTHS